MSESIECRLFTSLGHSVMFIGSKCIKPLTYQNQILRLVDIHQFTSQGKEIFYYKIYAEITMYIVGSPITRNITLF